MAALISLAFVPLAFPFFILSRRVCTGWRCRVVAVAGGLLVFALGNFLLLKWLPIGSLNSLFSFSRPYLGAALLAMAWLYRSQAAAKPVAFKPAAALANMWWNRSIRQTLAH